MTEWNCVLPFDTDDPEFTRGFELGMLWERLERDGTVQQLIHDENTEMVMRIAESAGLPFKADEVADGWLMVTIG